MSLKAFDLFSTILAQIKKSIYCKYENKYGFTQYFLRSEKLNEYVKERFQVHSDNLSVLGLEIESFGGSGTAGAHPSSRLYFTDLMQGRTYGPQYISDLFKAMLESTGWYEVDDSFDSVKQILPFLNPYGGVSKGQNSEDMLVTPGWYTFPKDMICTKNNSQKSFYNYRYRALCNRVTTEEAQEEMQKNI